MTKIGVEATVRTGAFLLLYLIAMIAAPWPWWLVALVAGLVYDELRSRQAERLLRAIDKVEAALDRPRHEWRDHVEVES